MTKISAIVAVAENGVIGNSTGGHLGMPWHIASEFQYFRKTTLGHALVMGRKSFEALGGKPLPKRTNIIVTRDKNFATENVIVTHSLDEGISAAKKADDTEIFICGGAEIYRQSLPLLDRLYYTEVHLKPQGDILFPDLDRSMWVETKREFHKALPGEDADYTITVLERK